MKKPLFIELLRGCNLPREEKDFVENALVELSILFDEDFEAGSTLNTQDYAQVRNCGKYLQEELDNDVKQNDIDPYDV